MLEDEQSLEGQIGEPLDGEITEVDPTPVVGDCHPKSSWGTAKPEFANQVFELTNQHRAGLGLPSLLPYPELMSSAVWKSMHMAGYGYLEHSDPKPPFARNAGQRLQACGFDGVYWSENIASGYKSPEAVMKGWLASPGHRKNIESKRATHLGVGCAQRSNGVHYWTQNFGRLVRQIEPDV